MIENDEELLLVTTEVGEKIQEINDYLGQRNHPHGTIRFPRGYIRTCVIHRSKYQFVKDATLKSNVAYTLLLTDLFRWLLNRTDIAGQAKEMLIKKEISSLGSIAESITKDYLKGRKGGGKHYKYRSQVLVDEGIITKELKDEIDWVWDVRNGEHLALLKQRDWKVYKMKDCNRAIRALQDLRNGLDSHHGEGGF